MIKSNLRVFMLFGLYILYAVNLINFCISEESEKNDFVTIVVAVAPALVTALGVIITEVSTSRKVKNKIEELENKLGVDNNHPCLSKQHDNISADLSNKHNELKGEISRQIGDVNGKGSLTNQYLNLLQAVNSYKDEKETRIRKLSKEQKNIAKKIDEFRDFFADWEKTNDELQKVKARIDKLEIENKNLKIENEALKRQFFSSEDTVLLENEADDYELER